ncbi:MAG: hypothetical protein KAS29_17825, partial [Bacteroidales bacterium]|nr:hypothetical protein [Bacteroidales bacterium]
MKIKIYILTTVLALFTITGCEKGFEEMNKDPFNPTVTSIPPVFNSMVGSLLRGWQPQTQFEYEGMGLSSQICANYGTSGYLPENAAKEMWENYYQYLADAKLFDRLIEDNETDLKFTNLIAQKNIIHAYKTVKMLDIFGDIPYYDAAKAIEGSDYFYP